MPIGTAPPLARPEGAGGPDEPGAPPPPAALAPGFGQRQRVAVPVQAAGGAQQLSLTFRAAYLVVDNFGPTPVGVSTVGPPTSTGATAAFVVAPTSWVAVPVAPCTRVWLNSATPLMALPWGPVSVYALDTLAASTSPGWASGRHPGNRFTVYATATHGVTYAKGPLVFYSAANPFAEGAPLWIESLWVYATGAVSLRLPVPYPGGFATTTYGSVVTFPIPKTTGLSLPLGGALFGSSPAAPKRNAYVQAATAGYFAAAVTYRGFPPVKS